MTEQTVDIPLLRKAVEWAEAEAAKPFEQCGWYQPTYMKSVMRDDGTDAMFLDHEDPYELQKKSPDINGCGTAFCIAGWTYAEHYGMAFDDEDQLDTEATRLLGLSPIQAVNLFAGSNSIADVRRIAEDIAGERL